jgi:hypothetical protein
MIQNREDNILNLKLILYCFKSMSELKINYHKSEVYVVGGDQKVKEEIAGVVPKDILRYTYSHQETETD